MQAYFDGLFLNTEKMNDLLNFLRLFLLSTSGVLLLCVIFASNPELAHGVTMGKVCWFHFCTLFLAGSVLFMEMTVPKSHFTFSLPDCLLLFLFGLTLSTYNRELNLQPERFIFAAQLIVLWFMLRATLQMYQVLRIFFITIIMFTGFIVAIWGINNLNSSPSSTSPVFNQLRASISLEPFTGYIAIVLPLCLNLILRFCNCIKSAWWETRTFLFYFAIICSLTIVAAMVIGMNKPAWAAGLISCIWVCWMRLIGWNRTKEIIKRYNKTFGIGSVILIFLIAGAAMLHNISRAEAGDRQLLVWNVTTKAIMEQPLTGTGLGGFPRVFAETQAAYFASGIASPNEIAGATCPEYARNEYLQTGVEQGIPGLLLFMFWLAFSLYYGVKHRQIGASGGVVSLLVFAMYSYPLQLPTFWIVLIFFTTICATDPKKRYVPRGKRNIPYIGALAAIASCFIFYGQKDCADTYKEWKALQELYQDQKYEVASYQYSYLYTALQHRSDFLFEGADCFSQTGEYSIAISWLKRALEVSSDPDIYYAIARNEREVGRYTEAESHLLEAIQMLPEKGYAYFMLAQLYAEPAFFQPQKLRVAADKVLLLQSNPKSGVTPEMKGEVCNLLKVKSFSR